MCATVIRTPRLEINLKNRTSNFRRSPASNRRPTNRKDSQKNTLLKHTNSGAVINETYRLQHPRLLPSVPRAKTSAKQDLSARPSRFQSVYLIGSTDSRRTLCRRVTRCLTSDRATVACNTCIRIAQYRVPVGRNKSVPTSPVRCRTTFAMNAPSSTDTFDRKNTLFCFFFIFLRNSIRNVVFYKLMTRRDIFSRFSVLRDFLPLTRFPVVR